LKKARAKKSTSVFNRASTSILIKNSATKTKMSTSPNPETNGKPATHPPTANTAGRPAPTDQTPDAQDHLREIAIRQEEASKEALELKRKLEIREKQLAEKEKESLLYKQKYYEDNKETVDFSTQAYRKYNNIPDDAELPESQQNYLDNIGAEREHEAHLKVMEGLRKEILEKEALEKELKEKDKQLKEVTEKYEKQTLATQKLSTRFQNRPAGVESLDTSKPISMKTGGPKTPPPSKSKQPPVVAVQNSRTPTAPKSSGYKYFATKKSQEEDAGNDGMDVDSGTDKAPPPNNGRQQLPAGVLGQTGVKRKEILQNEDGSDSSWLERTKKRIRTTEQYEAERYGVDLEADESRNDILVKLSETPHDVPHFNKSALQIHLASLGYEKLEDRKPEVLKGIGAVAFDSATWEKPASNIFTRRPKVQEA